jgi:hypothetical protein
VNWKTFTRRTEDPKLRWLQHELARAGIPNRRNGESFHAPILEVPAEKEEAAWAILTPALDAVPDDDERFRDPEPPPCCMCGAPAPLADEENGLWACEDCADGIAEEHDHRAK